MKSDLDGRIVRWKMHIEAGPAAVFAALDSDDGRAAFWAESAVERGGHIEFEFINGYSCRSRIVERRSPGLFVLDYMGGTARFELSDDGKGGTDLALTHKNIGPADWDETHAGWLNVLFPLKAWVTHGIDLRNHDPERTWDQGYADS